MEQQRYNPFVRARRERNLSDKKVSVDCNEFWKQMLGMRLTSVQRSGPESPVARFLRKDPLPLRYEAFAELGDQTISSFIEHELIAHGGIRFPKRISEDLEYNYLFLNHGNNRDQLLAQVNLLTSPQSREVERQVARHLQSLLKGFGPKQSRNLLQALGLTRYEIPIDSRIASWLKDFGFPMRLSATTLSDVYYYEFVLDAIQALCVAAKIYPCVLDAAIFASFDGDGWNQENVIF